MVKYKKALDFTFTALASPIRRDILKRLTKIQTMTISEVAKPYKISLVAVSKHLHILEKATIVIMRRRGKEFWVSLSPASLKIAIWHLQRYEAIQGKRLKALDDLLANNKKAPGAKRF